MIQVRQGRRAVVRVANRATTPTESQSPAPYLELGALAWAIDYFQFYLHERHFRVVTDHRALKWLQSFKFASGRFAQWRAIFSSHSFDVVHRAGKRHVGADALSRSPGVFAEEPLLRQHRNQAPFHCHKDNWERGSTGSPVSIARYSCSLHSSGVRVAFADKKLTHRWITSVAWRKI